MPALLAVLFLLLSVQGLAQSDHYDRFEVSLVTVGPGQTYWQRFGHNAILVRSRDAAGDPGIMYNYGLFDFQQKNFLLNFLRGNMSYRMAAFYADQELASYVTADRDVTIQPLNLSPGQKQQLINYLEWNRQPENSAYHYDYFLSNCSTRVRDVLDKTLDGLLKTRFSRPKVTRVLRDHVQRLTSPDLALYVGTGLGLGQPVDRTISRWDEFFLPMELQRSLTQVVLPDGSNLVRQTIVLNSSTKAEPELAPDWLAGFLLAGILLAVILGLVGFRRTLARRTMGVWYLLCGLSGMLLAALWLFSDHQAAWYNENLLLFSPLGLLAAGPLLFGRITRFARDSAMLVAALAVTSLALKFSPWFYQDNLELAALALPIHLACLGLLLRDPPAPNHDH